jgi:ribosomal protein L29
MNKPMINSYDDLLKEQERLRKQLNVQKAELNDRITIVKEKLAPVGTILSAVSGIAAMGAKNPLVTSGIGLAVDMFVKKRLFKNTGLITGILGSFLLRNVATKVVAGTAGVLVSKLIKSLGKKSPKAATQE